MNREEKQHAVDSLHEKLKVSRTILLAGFEGLKVTQAVELRRKMAAAGARYQVVKNRLLERAAKGTPAEDVAQGLKGTTSMSYTEEDPVALAKLVVEYAKANPKFSFKAGMVEGSAISVQGLNQLASLPSKEMLYAQMAGAVKAVMQYTVSAAAALPRQMVMLVREAHDKGKFKAEGA